MKTTSPKPATRRQRRAYPVYSVVRYRRPDRAPLAVEGDELTHEEASRLACALRDEHRGDEGSYGFAVQTLPLARQAVILDFPERPSIDDAPLGPDLYGSAGLAGFALGRRLAELEA